MELKIKKLDERATLPTYGSEGAACFDLYALESGVMLGGNLADYAHEKVEIVRTGLAVEVPSGWSLDIYSRSGHGFNHGVRLGNAVGILDADYRGEIMVCLHNDGDDSFGFKAGDRIAQARLSKIERVSFIEVDELSDTARGTGGFGSTGK